MQSNPDLLESRLQETEIKLAFLEKELEAYKDAVQELHARLTWLEKTVRALGEAGEASGSAQGASDAPETDGS